LIEVHCSDLSVGVVAILILVATLLQFGLTGSLQDQDTESKSLVQEAFSSNPPAKVRQGAKVKQEHIPSVNSPNVICKHTLWKAANLCYRLREAE